MSLSVGIVGLPNAGKSTLFNALAARRLAETATHPFTTIEPHEAVVAVPDERLNKLSKLRGLENAEVHPATVTFMDIAGLVKGASKGEGLGNQFLGKIREVDAIVHVVRAFEDPNVAHVHGKIDPKEDIEVVNLELELAGIEKRPTIYVLNVGEEQVGMDGVDLGVDGPVVKISAKLEEELADLSSDERKQYLQELGVVESGLEKLIRESYDLLGLITFYTVKGGERLQGLSLVSGSTALAAAEKVHTDFAEKFVKAEVVGVDELVVAGSWQAAKEKGKVRLEGKDYLVQDGDVIEFKVGA